MYVIMFNKFIENTKIRRGFIRVILVCTLGVFGWGAYYSFSPSAYLYEGVDYEDVILRATFDLKDEGCNKGYLAARRSADKFNGIKYMVFDEDDKGQKIRFFNDCKGLELYGETIGLSVVDSALRVVDLSEYIIREEVSKIKVARNLEIIRDRVESGARSVINFWVVCMFIVAVGYTLRWVLKGFK